MHSLKHMFLYDRACIHRESKDYQKQAFWPNGYLFMVSDVGLGKKSKWTLSVYMYDDPTEETGVSLPTSVNERASDTTNKMASPSFIDKGPSIDWSTDDNLYNCFKMWKQRCELLPGRLRKLKKKSNASIYYTGRKNTESNYSTAGICPQLSEKSWKINGWDWKNFVMPHSNELIAMWELHDLWQGTLSPEESIAKLRILVKEANYPVKRNDRFMRDFLVLGMKYDCVWKDWFKVGNAPTFKEVCDMAKSEESADKQLQLMNTKVYSINVPKGYSLATLLRSPYFL